MVAVYDKVPQPGQILEGIDPAVHVGQVETPACYVIECRKFEDVLDSVRGMSNCPVTYSEDPLTMANATIARMRRLADICARELELLVKAPE